MHVGASAGVDAKREMPWSRGAGERDRKACVEATRSAVAGHPSDGVTKTNSQSALGGRIS
jgi:hypothetical protein